MLTIPLCLSDDYDECWFLHGAHVCVNAPNTAFRMSTGLPGNWQKHRGSHHFKAAEGVGPAEAWPSRCRPSRRPGRGVPRPNKSSHDGSDQLRNGWCVFKPFRFLLFMPRCLGWCEALASACLLMVAIIRRPLLHFCLFLFSFPADNDPVSIQVSYSLMKHTAS